jgi:hypothetical protein
VEARSVRRAQTGSEGAGSGELMATAISQYVGYQKKVRRGLPIAVVERV